VPIYQAAGKDFAGEESDIGNDRGRYISVIEENGRDGVDFITVHCGVTRLSVAAVEEQGRILGIVSRGGAMTANWMYCNKRENPLMKNRPASGNSPSYDMF